MNIDDLIVKVESLPRHATFYSTSDGHLFTDPRDAVRHESDLSLGDDPASGTSILHVLTRKDLLSMLKEHKKNGQEEYP